MTLPTPSTRAETPRWTLEFNEYLLGGVLALIAVGALLVVALYALPPGRLALTELEPAFRVGRAADFPVGASRVVNWGDRIILVIRTDEQAYAALQGTAPTDGCILSWDARSLRVWSPCSYLVYDLHGNVVRGLTTVPLRRYAVFVRDDVVYVSDS